MTLDDGIAEKVGTNANSLIELFERVRPEKVKGGLLVNRNGMLSYVYTASCGVIPMSIYDGAEPMAISAALYGDDEQYSIPTDAKQEDLDRPLDVRIVNLPDDGVIVCERVTAPRPGWFRIAHKVPRHRHMLCTTRSFVRMADARYSSERTFFGSHNGVDWVAIRPPDSPMMDPKPDSRLEDPTLYVGLMRGKQFTRQLHWHVFLARPGSPALALPTDAQGVLALLKSREVPDGKARRAALTHWVKSHLRQSRSGGMHEVTAHLRGNHHCKWFDLEVGIEPSMDVMRQLKPEAAVMWGKRIDDWRRRLRPERPPAKPKKKRKR